GQPDRALIHLFECAAFLESIAIDDPDLSTAPDIVEALLRLGRLTEAREICDRYQPTAEAKGQPFALARAARSRALVAGDEGFGAEYEAALQHHAATPDIFERARTQLYFVERLRRTRRRVDARRQLGGAFEAFDQLGAAAWAERGLKQLAAGG